MYIHPWDVGNQSLESAWNQLFPWPVGKTRFRTMWVVYVAWWMVDLTVDLGKYRYHTWIVWEIDERFSQMHLFWCMFVFFQKFSIHKRHQTPWIKKRLVGGIPCSWTRLTQYILPIRAGLSKGQLNQWTSVKLSCITGQNDMIFHFPCIPNYQLLPSWELTYPLPVGTFEDDFPFLPGGIC